MGHGFSRDIDQPALGLWLKPLKLPSVPPTRTKRSSSPSRTVQPLRPFLAVIQRSAFRDEGSPSCPVSNRSTPPPAQATTPDRSASPAHYRVRRRCRRFSAAAHATKSPQREAPSRTIAPASASPAGASGHGFSRAVTAKMRAASAAEVRRRKPITTQYFYEYPKNSSCVSVSRGHSLAPTRTRHAARFANQRQPNSLSMPAVHATATVPHHF